MLATVSAQSRFEMKLICDSANVPDMRLDEDHYLQVLLAVREGCARAATGHKHLEYRSALSTLLQKRFVIEENGALKLAVPIFTQRWVAEAASTLDVMAEEIADVVERHASAIRNYCAALPGISSASSESASLLIFSNVLFDEFQIEAVERELLAAPRPRRNGGSYYVALMESASDEGEAFGIYGNHVTAVSPSFGVHVYGNRKYVPGSSIITPGEPFGGSLEGRRRLAAFRAELIMSVLRRSQGAERDLDYALTEKLERLGMVGPDGRPMVPLLDPSDIAALSALADRFRPYLIKVLRGQWKSIQAMFAGAEHATHSVSFEEWFMWWYHLLYTAVTDKLIDRGLITVPATGNVTYFTVRRRA